MLRSIALRMSTTTGAALAALGLSVAGLAVLPPAPAFAATATHTTGGPTSSLGQVIAQLRSQRPQHVTRSLQPADSNNGIVCSTHNTTIRSVQNGQYVTTQLDYTGDQYGMLRAHIGTPGPWEQFNICLNTTTNTYTIRSVQNGQYVTTQLDYTGTQYGMLRAHIATPGPWEQFTFAPTGNGYSIRSVANGNYVTAQMGFSGNQYAELTATDTAADPGSWEQFQ
ncbi:fascin domain-containing protein [Kitasatospora sp. NPDC052896]|uniref:fascin domain-containing protein n=1 Tax=Kitasatospora sp. NPDC052896 TaxID=3364061 RepID=UPI0037C72917